MRLRQSLEDIAWLLHLGGFIRHIADCIYVLFDLVIDSEANRSPPSGRTLDLLVHRVEAHWLALGFKLTYLHIPDFLRASVPPC